MTRNFAARSMARAASAGLVTFPTKMPPPLASGRRLRLAYISGGLRLHPDGKNLQVSPPVPCPHPSSFSRQLPAPTPLSQYGEHNIHAHTHTMKLQLNTHPILLNRTCNRTCSPTDADRTCTPPQPDLQPTDADPTIFSFPILSPYRCRPNHPLLRHPVSPPMQTVPSPEPGAHYRVWTWGRATVSGDALEALDVCSLDGAKEFGGALEG